MHKRTCKILIAATGSVAALKIPILIKSLLDLSAENEENAYLFEIHLIVTEHAKHFFKIYELPKEVKVYEDALEWTSWSQRGDPVLHIELGNIADIMLIAPLDANSLAKISNGLCDNLVTCTVRAWDLKKPLLFCPAMNVRMWEHPVTSKQVATLKEWGFTEVPPISKKLMCGDVGMGAMAEVQDIVKMVVKVADQRLASCS